VADPTSTDALASLRVVEIAQGVAGPACGYLFAALGHAVRKCEPPGGDYQRGYPPPGVADGLAFEALNGGKSSVVADVADPAGRRTVHGLLAGADVLITDLSPAAAAVAGLTAGELRTAYPDLVAVSVTPFGLSGELAGSWGDSLLAESYGGLAAMIGDPSRRPLSLGGEQAAHAAGIVGFLGAMLALRRRDLGSGGDLVDVAMSDVAAYIDWKSDIGYTSTGLVPLRAGVTAGRWRLMPASDGLVGIIFQPEQWHLVVALIDDERLADPALADELERERRSLEWWPAIGEWVARRTKLEAYHEAQAGGLAFGYCADVADLAASPQYQARHFITGAGGPGAGRTPTPVTGPLLRSAELGWRDGPAPALGSGPSAPWPARPAGQETRPRGARRPDAAPLEGVRVVDLGTITAGAATSRLLADYGATVLKVESHRRPDAFRWWLPAGATAEMIADLMATAPMFESNNAGKTGVLCDLDTAAGHAQFLDLVRGADVVVENFRVGVTDKLGIGYDRLREVNPGLIYLSLSSQGQDGPEARYRSYGSTLDLISGLVSVTGYDQRHPAWSSFDVNYPDQLVSLLGAAAVVYCLRQGVRGTHLDIAQREVVSWSLAEFIADYQRHGRIGQPSGNRRPGRTPHDTYQCGDGRWIAVACGLDYQRAALGDLVGLPGSGGRERWWLDRQDEADAAISRWAGRRNRDDGVAALAAAGVPAVPVLTAGERAAEPHFRHRRVFLDGSPRLKGFPLVLNGYAPPRPAPAPTLSSVTDPAGEPAPGGGTR
jgi:crotonobetainyl-CoA:carnitine CoA-transferase CaiB-like acyl-CoA transferase